MLKDEINSLYDVITQNYCTDQMFNWAYNYTKQQLINQGQGNYEPSREYMILLLIDRITIDIQRWIHNNNIAEQTYIKNFQLNNYQLEQIRNIATKANGGAATFGGGGAAGAGAGFMFGGLIGAAVGGIIGALAGNSYNNQNRQKFYDVLRECISELTSGWYQNNLAYEQDQYKLLEEQFINKMSNFGDKFGFDEDELTRFADDAYKKGYHVAYEEDLEKTYEIVYGHKPIRKPKKSLSIDENIDDVLKELEELIGLENVKKQVKNFVNQVKVFKMREEQGLPNPNMSYHLVFTGNPGTGKTTVARIVGRIYKALGILSNGNLVETDRSGLVGGYVGQTAIKTQEVISSAMGGVLFIDEAYSLARSDSANDFGAEAIDTLLKSMEDNRSDFIVISAGYSNEMDKFIKSNPGLKSRFKTFINFEDYNGEEMFDIFILNCKKYNYVVDEIAKGILRNYFDYLYMNRGENFGNGRDVRNVFENTITNQSQRVANIKKASKKTLQTIVAEDLAINY